MTAAVRRRRRAGAVTATMLTALLALSGAGSAATEPTMVASTTPARAAAEPDTIRPLVIVLDTSGSMAEDDGTGTIKLAGAQAALSNVIRQQRPGAQIGLWSYPSDSSCAPGRFQIPVKDLDQRSMIRAIRRLEANGETPTGEALRTVVDDLTANGYGGATILLISDGLSNCGADPCQVAEEISAEGFDLTVNTAGFQISTEGQDELDCIASTTGGSTYEATDSAELGETIADATRAELEMEITGLPTEIPAGSATRVKVTVTNASAVDVEDARISFTFGATGEQQSIIPAVLPPVVRLGNLPAGAVAEHSWVVSYGSQGKIGTTEYRVAAWGSNAQPRESTGVVRVTDSALGWDEADGKIAELEGERIAILGDSYSSGEGGGDYLAGTDEKGKGGNRCHKSPHTYLYPLFDGSDVDLIACSGATTHRIGEASSVQDDQVPELREVQDDRGPVAAAFMTIGGNDIEFAHIVRTCVGLGTCSEDQEFTDRAERLLRGLQPDLEETYEQVYQALNDADAVEERGDELAPLYILPYPQPFPEPQWTSWCKGFSAEEIAWANDLVDDLDGVIEQAVHAVRKKGYRVHLISTVQETFLPDNTACPRPGAEEYLHSVDMLSGGMATVGDWWNDTKNVNEFMHPNAKGYRAETNVVLAWSVNTPEELPDGVSEWRPPPQRSPLQGLIDGIADALTPTLPTWTRSTATFDARQGEFTSDPIDVRAGQRFTVEVVNAAPGSRVTVMVESRAQRIGSVRIGDDGAGRATIDVPADLPSGQHQLTSIAVAEDGGMAVGSQAVDVSRAFPPWLLPLAVGTLLAFAASALLARRHRRLPAVADIDVEIKENDRP